MNAPKLVNCPTCKKPVPWLETSTWRPFCSKKCQLIDFGEWATEKHSIPVEETDLFSEDELEDTDRQD